MSPIGHRLAVVLAMICAAFLPAIAHAQSTLTLQPDAASGQDARINFLFDYPMYERAELPASAWTWDVKPGLDRCLIRFDLGQIPSMALIDRAILHLFGSDDLPSGSHYTEGGPNAFSILRIIDPWDEKTVHWSNQPEYTALHQVYQPASRSNVQNYVIDVTQLVRDMFADPGRGHGFMVKLTDERFNSCSFDHSYRRINFASSNHNVASRRPMLVVSYSAVNAFEATPGTGVSAELFPNPTDGPLNVRISPVVHSCAAEVFDPLGRRVAFQPLVAGGTVLDLALLPPGGYLVRIQTGDKALYRIATKK